MRSMLKFGKRSGKLHDVGTSISGSKGYSGLPPLVYLHLGAQAPDDSGVVSLRIEMSPEDARRLSRGLAITANTVESSCES